MLFSNPRRILSEAATAELLDPEVSEEVKDTVEELEDTLTNNVEEVDEKDMTTNGGVPVTTESVSLMESASWYNDRTRYLVNIESVIAVMETEGAAEAEANAEPGQAPTEEECEKNEPEASNVIDDIAEKNGVDPEQVAVVITAEHVQFLAETALLESKAGKRKGKAGKKLKKLKDVIDDLQRKGKKIKFAKK